jgi:hypothetical protein
VVSLCCGLGPVFDFRYAQSISLNIVGLSVAERIPVEGPRVVERIPVEGPRVVERIPVEGPRVVEAT